MPDGKERDEWAAGGPGGGTAPGGEPGDRREPREGDDGTASGAPVEEPQSSVIRRKCDGRWYVVTFPGSTRDPFLQLADLLVPPEETLERLIPIFLRSGSAADGDHGEGETGARPGDGKPAAEDRGGPSGAGEEQREGGGAPAPEPSPGPGGEHGREGEPPGGGVP